MDWTEFAEKIEGEFQENSSGFIGGDVIIKKIIKEDELGNYEIEKRLRRSYEASSHCNLEKLNWRFHFNEIDFEKCRIVKKPLFRRLGKPREKCYNVEGEGSESIKKLLLLEELNYLLDYPKSEFFLIGSSINFRSQFIGEMEEELEKIYESIEKIKSELI